MSLFLLSLAAPLCAVPGSWRVLGPDGGSVYDLAFAASRPQALYAATAGGVYRSLDGGASWGYSNAGLDESPQVSSLAVDPVHPLTVYAAQNGGIYRSRDGGASWLSVSSEFGVVKIVLPARSSGVVYAMSGSALYRSNDPNDLSTWKVLTRGLPASYRPIDLVADPVDPNRLYAIVVGIDSHVYELFKSVDGGFHWKRADQGIPANQGVFSLAIDPRSPKVLYAGTGDDRVYKSRDGGALWRPQRTVPDGYAASLWVSPAGTLFAATVDRLFRAESNGSWTDVSQGLPEAGSVRALIFPAGNPRSPLAAVSTYGIRRGGVFASSDGGSSWVLRSRGISALNVTSAAAAPDALWAVADEVLFKSADRGETWKQVRFAPVDLTTLVAVAPSDPETVYAVLYYGTVWRSHDGGGSWEEAGNPKVQPGHLVLDPRSPSTLYVAGTGLLKSTDGGTTWTPLLDGVVYDLEISPSSPSTLYAVAGSLANHSNQLLRSTDGGSTWVSMPTPENRILVTLAIDPQAPETLYTAFDGRIYRSTDGASSWSPYGNYFQFPEIVLYPLLFPASPAALHVGVRLDNVYRLVDGGDPNSWEPLGKSPGHLRYNVLAADPQDPCRIYAATDSRGLLAFTESGTAQCP
jgi:photosystem II stability/assembly factor-like uncharacterized protein